jgi:4-amino-4-deoxy-L-arabinose transferase-like glycosyltransferase
MKPAAVATIARAFLICGLGAVLVAAVSYEPRSGATLGALSPLIESLVALGAWASRLPAHGLLTFLALLFGVIAAAIAVRGAVLRLPIGRQLRPALAPACTLGAVAAAAAGRLVIAAVAACVLALVLRSPKERLSGVGRPGPSLELLLAILLAGAVVRFYSLAEYSPGFGTHATYHLSFAIDLYEKITGSGAPDAAASVSLFEKLWPGYVDLQHGPMAVINALGFMVFGVGFEHARMTQAVLGVINIWIVFLLGKQLVDERVGLAAALLLAFSPWHIAISRFNDAEHVLAPLQAALAAYLVLRAARQAGTTRDWALAGIGCGLSWYVYATNQVMMVGLLAFVAWFALTGWRRLRSEWPKLVVFATSFLVISLPHLESTVRMGRPLPMRSGYTPGGAGIYAIAHFDRVLENIGGSLRQLFVQVDDQWFARPAGGGLGMLEAGLFAGGVAWCLLGLARRGSRDQSVFVLIWLVAGFVPALVLQHVEFRRLLLAALLCTLLSTILLTHAGVLLARTTWGRRVLLLLGPPAVLLYAACNLHLYFNEIKIPESESSVYYVQVVNQIRNHAGHGPTVVVLPPEGQHEQHRNAARLGAYEELRPLLRAGTPVEEIYRFVEADQLRTNLMELTESDGPIRIVAPSFQDGAVLHCIDNLIRELDPGHPSMIDGQEFTESLLVWELPPAAID